MTTELIRPEQRVLLEEVRYGNDRAAEELLKMYEGLITSVRLGYFKTPHLEEDLMQAGMAATWEAFLTWDEAQGSTLHNWVWRRVWRAMVAVQGDLGHAVRLPYNAQKKWRKVQAAIRKLEDQNLDPTLEDLAALTGLPAEEVDLLQNIPVTVPLDQPLGDEDEALTAADILAVETPYEAYGSDTSEEEILAYAIMSSLTPEEQQIVSLIAIEGKTQQEVANLLGVSQQAVSARYDRILNRIRNQFGGEA